jgi:hypothetical protein
MDRFYSGQHYYGTVLTFPYSNISHVKESLRSSQHTKTKRLVVVCFIFNHDHLSSYFLRHPYTMPHEQGDIQQKASMDLSRTKNTTAARSSTTGQDAINDKVQNSFSANSPYYISYVENEMRSMNIMNDTLKDIVARTKTFGKCGVLMSESTRRLALACRLRRPYVVEDEKDAEEIERQHEIEVAERRRAVGDDMASLLSVMSEVSVLGGSLLKRWILPVSQRSLAYFLLLPRCWMKFQKRKCKCVGRSR